MIKITAGSNGSNCIDVWLGRSFCVFCGLWAFQAEPRFLPQYVSVNLELGFSVAFGGALDAVVAVVVAVRRSSPPAVPRGTP